MVRKNYFRVDDFPAQQAEWVTKSQKGQTSHYHVPSLTFLHSVELLLECLYMNFYYYVSSCFPSSGQEPWSKAWMRERLLSDNLVDTSQLFNTSHFSHLHPKLQPSQTSKQTQPYLKASMKGWIFIHVWEKNNKARTQTYKQNVSVVLYAFINYVLEAGCYNPTPLLAKPPLSSEYFSTIKQGFIHSALWWVEPFPYIP